MITYTTVESINVLQSKVGARSNWLQFKSLIISAWSIVCYLWNKDLKKENNLLGGVFLSILDQVKHFVEVQTLNACYIKFPIKRSEVSFNLYSTNIKLIFTLTRQSSHTLCSDYRGSIASHSHLSSYADW